MLKQMPEESAQFKAFTCQHGMYMWYCVLYTKFSNLIYLQLDYNYDKGQGLPWQHLSQILQDT